MAIDWKHITHESLLPSLVIGPIVGAGVTAATSQNKEEFKRDITKGIIAGTIGDALTGLGLGLWGQRKNIPQISHLFKGAACFAKFAGDPSSVKVNDMRKDIHSDERLSPSMTRSTAQAIADSSISIHKLDPTFPASEKVIANNIARAFVETSGKNHPNIYQLDKGSGKIPVHLPRHATASDSNRVMLQNMSMGLKHFDEVARTYPKATPAQVNTLYNGAGEISYEKYKDAYRRELRKEEIHKNHGKPGKHIDMASHGRPEGGPYGRKVNDVQQNMIEQSPEMMELIRDRLKNYKAR